MSERVKDLKVERTCVVVNALTANTCEVVIDTTEGAVRLICAHDSIEIEANGIKVLVKP